MYVLCEYQEQALKKLYKEIYSKTQQISQSGILENSTGGQDKENREKNRGNKQKIKQNKMTDLSPNISITILSRNGLNTPIKETGRLGKNNTELYANYKKLALYIMM